MDTTDHDLPQDLDACHALIGQLRQEREQSRQLQGQQAETISQQQATIEEMQATIDRMAAEMALLKRSLFGSRRERYVDDPLQKHLFNTTEVAETAEPLAPQAEEPTEKEEAEEPAPKPRRTSKGRNRRVFPDFLPRESVRHPLNENDIPEELRNDPTAQRFWKKTGETLDLQPAKMTVLEHYQEVIVKNDEAGETTMATARKPPRLIDAYVEPGFLAFLTAGRFADHLPYYRHEDIFSRCGFRIGRNTQCRWMIGLAQGLEPLVALMRRRALASLILGVDETPIRLLRLALLGSVKSYLWCTVGDRGHPYDCFYFTVDRATAGPEKFLSGFRGYLQSDAYVGYERLAGLHEEVLKVSCWAHARRKFEEVHFTGATLQTHQAMGYFQRLYDIEDRAREFSDEQRAELRGREARPLVTTFHEWLQERYEAELPKSKLRAAIGYMVNRWDSFERYLEHGGIPFDNNHTEAALKFAILGRKAWLFFGSEQGGEAAASLFTLTKSCNRHRIDPYAYLRDVYIRLPTISTESELERLLPDLWIQEHPEHLIQERVDEAVQRAERKRRRRAERREAAHAQ